MALEVRGVHHFVNGSLVLSDLSASFEAGRVTAIVGPPGAGQSALVRLLAGIATPTVGRVWVNGKRLSLYAPTSLKCVLAHVAQDTREALDHTVHDVVKHGRFVHRYAPSPDEAGIVAAAMALTDVNNLAEQTLNALSSVDRAKAQLAHALVQIWESPPSSAPRWLLLEESDPDMPQAAQDQLLRTACEWALERRVGVVCALSDPTLAKRHASHALVLRDGVQLVRGPSAVVLPSVDANG